MAGREPWAAAAAWWWECGWCELCCDAENADVTCRAHWGYEGMLVSCAYARREGDACSL